MASSLIAFYLLAYAFSWSIGVPLALQAQGVTRKAWPYWLHYLTAFGPVLAAFVVTRAGRQPTPPPAARRRDRLLWLSIGAFSPLALFLAGRALGAVAGQTTPAWSALGRVNFLPELGVGAWPLWLATNGLGEETGWRGFALRRLQASHSPFTSTLLVTIAWAGWHAPMFFYVPSFMAISPAVIPGFFLGMLSGAIVLTWLYNESGGSVLAVALWHASFNFVTASPNAAGLSAATTSTLVMAWALVILFLRRNAMLVLQPPAHAAVAEVHGVAEHERAAADNAVDARPAARANSLV